MKQRSAEFKRTIPGPSLKYVQRQILKFPILSMYSTVQRTVCWGWSPLINKWKPTLLELNGQNILLLSIWNLWFRIQIEKNLEHQIGSDRWENLRGTTHTDINHGIFFALNVSNHLHTERKINVRRKGKTDLWKAAWWLPTRRTLCLNLTFLTYPVDTKLTKYRKTNTRRGPIF